RGLQDSTVAAAAAGRPRRGVSPVVRTRSARCGGRLGEGLAAAAGALGVGVADREPGALQAVLVVERRALQELEAGWVDHHLHPAVLRADVVLGRVGVEEHLVAVARAPAGADGDAERERLGAVLGVEQRADLLGR